MKNLKYRFLPIFAAALILVTPVLQAQNSAAVVGSIDFLGNKSISSQLLKSAFRYTREGGRYSPQILEMDLKELEKVYRNSGFMKVMFNPPAVQTQTANGRTSAAIVISVVEGPMYRTAGVTITKSGVLPGETLLQMFPLQNGQPYSRNMVDQWREKAQDAYRSMGYLHARCSVDENINELTRAVRAALACEEGKTYTIGKITFAGEGSVNPVELKRRLLFSEGGSFNPEMLFMTIQFLNQMEIYEPISDADVRMTIDDDKGIVDLSFRIVPRKIDAEPQDRHLK